MQSESVFSVTFSQHIALLLRYLDICQTMYASDVYGDYRHCVK